MRITVRRIEDGRVSLWANETAKAGDMLEMMGPAGRFCLRPHHGPLVLFAGGIGITPLLSLAKAALATTARPVALLHANRDSSSVVFAGELGALAGAHPGRFTLIDWIDSERGLIDAERLRALDMLVPGADTYICGPAAFMEIVEAAVLETGADREHVFLERFVSPPEDEQPGPSPAEEAGSVVCETLTVILRGQAHVLDYEPGETVLEAAYRSGLRPPISCLQGACATCMARVTQGSVHMRANDVLTPHEVEQGYALTCQGLPTARVVTLIYED